MQRANVSLSDQELKAIWTSAKDHANNFDAFKTTFSSGLFQGIEQIQNNKEFLRRELYVAARNGHFTTFKNFFEKGLVGVNDYYNNKTFLYATIKSDTQSEQHPATVGRKKIAAYLLEHNADIHQESYGLRGDSKASPWEMYEAHKQPIDDSWTGRLHSFFNGRKTPTYGMNIFPILQLYSELVQNRSMQWD